MAATALKPRAAVCRSQRSTDDRIAALCKQKLYSQALRAFDVVRSLPILPSTYAHLAAACSALRSPDHARALHRRILGAGSDAGVVLNNRIVTMYGKCGLVADARRAFDEMPERNAVSWAAMIAGYSQNGCAADAVGLYVDMLRSGLEPDRFALANAVRACSGLGGARPGEQLHCHAVKRELGFVPVVRNAVIALYADLGCVGGAAAAFEEAGERDLVSWSSMIAAYAQLGRELDALRLFREMMAANVHRPNEFVFGSVFSACGALVELEPGRQLHGVLLKLGLGGDAFSGCSLCGMYAKCGSIESAKMAFSDIESPDLASWNAIVSGLSGCSNAREAAFFFPRCGLWA